MALESHINQLEQKHHELESRLESMMKKPSVANLEIAEVKRQKLLIKDKIMELKRKDGLH